MEFNFRHRGFERNRKVDEPSKKSLKELREELVARVDKTKSSPSQRATLVYKILLESDLNNWDVVCFCDEYLGLMIETMPHIEKPAKELSQLIYTQHYLIEDNILEQIKIKPVEVPPS